VGGLITSYLLIISKASSKTAGFDFWGNEIFFGYSGLNWTDKVLFQKVLVFSNKYFLRIDNFHLFDFS